MSGLLIAALLVNTPRLQLMRQYATILCYLSRNETNSKISWIFILVTKAPTIAAVREFTPWSLIYPKGADGEPAYNPAGKYCVKLYWMGQWRKVTVDDLMPYDAEGRCLVMVTPIQYELWSMILCKVRRRIGPPQEQH